MKIARFSIIPFLFANVILLGVMFLSSKSLELNKGWELIAGAGSMLIGLGLATLLFYHSYGFNNKIVRVFLSILSLLFFLLLAGYLLESLGLMI